MKSISEKEITDQITKEFARALRKRLGKKVHEIILYGSRARGDFWEGSDFDFVVIVEETSHDLKQQILDISVQLLNQSERMISALVLSPEDWDFERWGPWGKNVLDEGISL